MKKNYVYAGIAIVSLCTVAFVGVGLKNGAFVKASDSAGTNVTATTTATPEEEYADVSGLEDLIEQTNKIANGYQEDIDAYASVQQADEFNTARTSLEDITRAVEGGLTQKEVDAYSDQIKELKTELKGAGEAALGNAPTAEETETTIAKTDEQQTSDSSVMNKDDANTELMDRIDAVYKVANGYADIIADSASVQQKEEFQTAVAALDEIKDAASGELSTAKAVKYLDDLNTLETEIQGAGDAAQGNVE